MKKFRTYSNTNRIKIIIIAILFLCLFIYISFLKLNSSYHELTNILLNNFDKTLSFNNLSFLTSDLDKLFNNYSFYQDNLVYKEEKNYIYLYNTHDTEKYSDGKSVIDAAKLFQNNLTKLGINTIVEDKKVSELWHTGLSYYDISRTFIKKAMNDNSIKYFIDIHRDSVSNTKVKINNKSYAKILFVLGLENENYQQNKAIMQKMNEYLNNHYPGISKGIYEKKGSDVDGVYNQDLDKNIILIEIGGVENNIEEVNNSTEILSLMLYNLLGD